MATVTTVPTALLPLAVLATYDQPGGSAAVADGLILLFATLIQGGAALALHRGPPKEDSSPTG